MTHLCLIHGWAANGHIFKDFRQRLPESWQSHAPHLPGHGGAPALADFHLDAAADVLAETLDEPAYLFGWSLGGLAALSLAARYPHKVKGLILCAAFAKFLAAPDYPEGVNHALLTRMLNLFEQDYAKHMRQFLELQLLRHPERNALIDALLPDMVQHGTPEALAAALAVVETADWRFRLPEIGCPVLLIYGSHDTLTPPRMGQYLLRHLPDARLHLIDKAAHTPFLSHADECAARVVEFVHQTEAAR